MGKTRNSATERRCPKCEGTGALEVPHWNPQLDTFRHCDEAGCVDGWIRWAPVDRLLLLAHWRRQIRGTGKAMRMHYEAELKRVAAPVNLPSDRYADPMFRQAMADVDNAVRLHKAIAPVFDLIFGRAA